MEPSSLQSGSPINSINDQKSFNNYSTFTNLVSSVGTGTLQLALTPSSTINHHFSADSSAKKRKRFTSDLSPIRHDISFLKMLSSPFRLSSEMPDFFIDDSHNTNHDIFSITSDESNSSSIFKDSLSISSTCISSPSLQLNNSNSSSLTYSYESPSSTPKKIKGTPEQQRTKLVCPNAPLNPKYTNQVHSQDKIKIPATAASITINPTVIDSEVVNIYALNYAGKTYLIRPIGHGNFHNVYEFITTEANETIVIDGKTVARSGVVVKIAKELVIEEHSQIPVIAKTITKNAAEAFSKLVELQETHRHFLLPACYVKPDYHNAFKKPPEKIVDGNIWIVQKIPEQVDAKAWKYIESMEIDDSLSDKKKAKLLTKLANLAIKNLSQDAKAALKYGKKKIKMMVKDPSKYIDDFKPDNLRFIKKTNKSGKTEYEFYVTDFSKDFEGEGFELQYNLMIKEWSQGNPLIKHWLRN